MNDVLVLEHLELSRERVAKGWVRGSWHLEQIVEIRRPWPFSWGPFNMTRSETRDAYCIMGSLGFTSGMGRYAASEISHDAFSEVQQTARTVLGTDDLVTWNDSTATQEQVLLLFDVTMERVRERIEARRQAENERVLLAAHQAALRSHEAREARIRLWAFGRALAEYHHRQSQDLYLPAEWEKDEATSPVVKV